MSEHGVNGTLHSKLQEVHGDIRELSSAIIDLREAVIDLKGTNKESSIHIKNGLDNLSGSIKTLVRAYSNSVPIKMVLIMLLATIVAVGVGRELDILLKRF